MTGRIVMTGVAWVLGTVPPVAPAARQAEPVAAATPAPATVGPPAVVVPTPAPTLAPETVPAAQPTQDPVVVPSPAATPRRRTPVTPRAMPTPMPEASFEPTTGPPPAIAPTPTPMPMPTSPPVAVPVGAPAPARFDWQPWLFGAAGLVLVALLWARLRREESAASAGSVVAAPPPEPEAAGARMVVALRPVRAGLNMVTAVVDCELTVTNAGDAPAEAVRVAMTLVSAYTGQQARVEAIDAAPITRTVVPAFALAPGESRVARVLAATPLEQLHRLQAKGRAMLVPLVLVNVEHRDADRLGWRTAQGFVVGVEGVDSSRLAPLWLDTPRMFDQVAARPAGEATCRRLP